jgi:hypothetical protein
MQWEILAEKFRAEPEHSIPTPVPIEELKVKPSKQVRILKYYRRIEENLFPKVYPYL